MTQIKIMKAKIHNNKPLIVFFSLTFLMAWGMMGLAVGHNYGWFGLTLPTGPFLVLGSWVPNIAAFLVLGLVVCKKGEVGQLLRSWLKFRVPAVCYFMIFIPLIVAATTLIVYKLIFDTVPLALEMLNPVSILLLVIMITITGAIGEEAGWRGFAQPRLQKSYGEFKAALLLGAIWVLWHTPLWFAGLGFEAIPFGAYAITGISFTVLVSRAFNLSQGSLAIASLFHLTLNLSINIIGTEALYVYSVLMALTAIALILSPAVAKRRKTEGFASSGSHSKL
jgi:uncharacterized protein